MRAQIPKHPTTTHNEQQHVAEHQGSTDSTLKRPQPQPPHIRDTFYRQLQPLFTEKHRSFMLRPPPQNKPHATVTQPLQCVLRHQVFNPHVSTHMAPERNSNHALYTEKHKGSFSDVTSHEALHECIVI